MGHLSRELFELNLEDSEKLEIVETLGRQLAAEPASKGIAKELLWALGKAGPAESVVALETILKRAVEAPLDPLESRQAILAVDDLSDLVENRDLESLLPLLMKFSHSVVTAQHKENRDRIRNLLLKLRQKGFPSI